MPHGNLVQAVERAAALLELAAGAPEGLGLRELAAGSGLKVSTAHNLLRTLVACRLLERVSRPVRFRLGPQLLELAERRLAGELPRRAAAELQRLARAWPGGVFTYAERVGADVLVTLRVTGTRPGFVERPLRHVMPPYTSASALLLLAWATPEALTDCERAHAFAEYGAHAWKSRAHLERFLANCRRGGLAEPEFGGAALRIVAAPVRGPGGTVRAALGAALPRTETAAAWPRLLRQLGAAADAVSAPVPRSP